MKRRWEERKVETRLTDEEIGEIWRRAFKIVNERSSYGSLAKYKTTLQLIRSLVEERARRYLLENSTALDHCFLKVSPTSSVRYALRDYHIDPKDWPDAS